MIGKDQGWTEKTAQSDRSESSVILSEAFNNLSAGRALMKSDNPRPDHDKDPVCAVDDEDEGEGELQDVDDYIEEEVQKRLWVRTIIPLLQLRSHESDPSSRVQLAFDLMHIAACERVARILRDDLPDDQGW
jgi:hypothetical protein